MLEAAPHSGSVCSRMSMKKVLREDSPVWQAPGVRSREASLPLDLFLSLKQILKQNKGNQRDTITIYPFFLALPHIFSLAFSSLLFAPYSLFTLLFSFFYHHLSTCFLSFLLLLCPLHFSSSFFSLFLPRFPPF